MKIAVLKETREGETRVAASPETVKKFIGLGASVVVETGAGDKARFQDSAFKEAGAEIGASAADAAQGADLVLKVQRPSKEELRVFGRGAKLAAILSPHADDSALENYAAAGVDAFAMDFMPRITRAQSMDVLSSQSNLAGYKAVVDAGAYYGPTGFQDFSGPVDRAAMTRAARDAEAGEKLWTASEELTGVSWPIFEKATAA